MTDPFDDKGQHLKAFPDSTLLDIARNGSAQHDYRLLSVEILVARKSPRAQHPDIQDLVRELEIELDGVVFENPAPSSGPLVASVTTKTMSEEPEPIANVPEETVDVPPTDPTPVPTEPEIKPRKPRKSKEPVDANPPAE
jgi:hypothetical protein